MSVFIYPPIQTSVSAAPVEYVLNGANTQVSQDTVTPSNSRPLPVVSLSSSGAVVTPATEAKQDTQIVEAQSTNTKLDTLNAKDFATQTTLAALEAKVLTDTQLRSSPVPVSGPLTDVQLRATPVPVSQASQPLPTGASTEAKQDTQIIEAQSTNTKLDTIIAKDFATSAKQDLQTIELQDIEADIEAGNVLTGAVNETAPATDTASSGLNGRLQRIAQRLTSLIALLPSSIGQKANADSLSVTLSTEMQTILEAIRDGARASVPNGSSQSNSTVGTTAANVAIPANTVGFIIQGYTGNAGLYWSLGATAANDGTSGHKLEDSRDSGFIPYAGTGNLSVIGEAASTRYQITWFTRS